VARSEGLEPPTFVRLEIEAALMSNVRVIPVLVEGARMPRSDELPANLASPARLQALELPSSRFHSDTGRLFKVLDAILHPEHGGPGKAERVRPVAGDADSDKPPL
jgi:hypothetical protein